MYTIRLGVHGLAHTRFAISPLFELCGLLELAARPGQAGPAQLPLLARTRAALDDGGLDLLAGLARPGYLPDLLGPHLDGPDGDLAAELAAVRATPAERVEAELEAMTSGRPASGLPGSDPAPAVADTIVRGPAAFTARAADELEQLWQLVLADGWSAMRAALAGDVTRRATLLAREGTAALLESLHPAVRWHESEHTVTVDGRYRVSRSCDDTLVLVPSAVRRFPNVLMDPCEGPLRAPVICYPAPLPAGDADGTRDLLGATRARLLADLVVARTTTELAARHHLTASSVSYHLGVLHRSGLATRSRQGARVLYRRTARADNLFG